jgi:hypothetical protein
LRKSSIFLLFVLGSTLALCFVLVKARLQSMDDIPRLRQQIKVVESLQLTDLCLATEARHTRHPSQADRHSPFQSHPGALDHFPSGSIILPPQL